MCCFKLFGIVLMLSMASSAKGLGNETEKFTFSFKAQSLIESFDQFQTNYGFPVSLLALGENEVIGEAVISKNREFVALKIERLSKSGGIEPIRIVIVAVATKQRRDYPSLFPEQEDWWISDLGAVSNEGSQILINVAKPIGNYVNRQWCVMDMKGMKVIATGLDGVFKEK